MRLTPTVPLLKPRHQRLTLRSPSSHFCSLLLTLSAHPLTRAELENGSRLDAEPCLEPPLHLHLELGTQFTAAPSLSSFPRSTLSRLEYKMRFPSRSCLPGSEIPSRFPSPLLPLAVR
jgi:hypothetical protein